MSNFKEVHGKLRLYVSFLEYGRHVWQLRRRRRTYAPTSNTASQDNHEKINSWVSFIFPLHDEYGAPLGGPSGHRSSAIKIIVIIIVISFVWQGSFEVNLRTIDWFFLGLDFSILTVSMETVIMGKSVFCII